MIDDIQDVAGGYLYTRSKSRWEFIDDVIVEHENERVIYDTTHVSYETVPHSTRERAYEHFRELENDPDAPVKDHLIIGWDE